MKTFAIVIATIFGLSLIGDWIEHTLPCYAPTGGNCKYGSSEASLRASAGQPKNGYCNPNMIACGYSR